MLAKAFFERKLIRWNKSVVSAPPAQECFDAMRLFDECVLGGSVQLSYKEQGGSNEMLYAKVAKYVPV